MPTTIPAAVTPTDRQTFLATLTRSAILAPAKLAKAAAAVPADAATAAAAADALVAAGFLTRFQADRLLAGRTDGFVVEPYVIREEVGRGPGGRVFKALHRTMNRTVVVKVLAPGRTATPAAREAFRREARAAARLNHPNVVTAFDANERGTRAYVVTEYVDGPDLARLVKERGPLPVGETCEIVRQAATALEYAREQGMTHRGIKPSNLLVARASKTLPGCVVKVADFGLARLPAAAVPVDAHTPAPPALSGTADYAAPEAAADHRSDLYSLGCVFYFLLTGRPPFPGGTAADKAARHRTEAPEPVEALRPDVPPTVAEVVRRLMAKDPNARFQSATALAAQLDVLAGGAAEGSGHVAFELPAAAPPSGGSHPGYLTGMNPRPGDTVPDPSPWAALTHEVRAPAGPRSGGLSAGMLLAVVLSVAAPVALGAGLLLRALAR